MNVSGIHRGPRAVLVLLIQYWLYFERLLILGLPWYLCAAEAGAAGLACLVLELE